MHAQLVPLEGGPAVALVKDMTLVGRKEDCDFRLDHKSISKLHCVLVKADGAVMVRDLGSTNGTRVNGTRVRRAVLLPNDRLSIANFHYRVLFGAALADALGIEATQMLSIPDLIHADRPMADSAGDVPMVKVQADALPDVYPEAEKPRA